MFAAVLVLGAIGCESAVSAPTAPVTPAVGTTRTTAADADDVPRVGTPRYSRDDASKDEAYEPTKDASRHEHRRGGGFSGYK